MKHTVLIHALLLLFPFAVYSQGDDCTSPINLTLDGVLRSYNTSSTTGDNLVCNSTGDATVTWFSFTTDASARCPIITITSPDSSNCEIALVTSCGGNINNNIQVYSSICFLDGHGIWAPAEDYVLLPNTVYYLRIKTDKEGSITISGQHFTPDNDDCEGAMPVGIDQVDENNACHKPGPVVTSQQLCAHTLENTAFYQYYVATTGITIINISNIRCDNGAYNNSSGFQIGFFTGTCNSLSWFYCTSGAGDFVQATTPSLPAGTKVYVAIDGSSGSNCSYKINALNAYSVLDLNIKKFTVWQNEKANILKWVMGGGVARRIDIQRSADGVQFDNLSIINVNNNDTTEKAYSFTDPYPFKHTYYRLMVTGNNGKVRYSPVRSVMHENAQSFYVKLVNPARSEMTGVINTGEAGLVQLKLVSSGGQIIWQARMMMREGENNFKIPSSSFIPGTYYLVVDSKTKVQTLPVIKL